MDIKLHNGDCLELMNTIPDGSVDMVCAVGDRIVIGHKNKLKV